MRLAVLGCGGAMGRVTLDELAHSPHVTALLAADLTINRAAAAAAACGPVRCAITPVGVDATDVEALTMLLAEWRPLVVVNCAQYSANLPAMHACLSIGAHYVDLGGLFHTSRQQFALHQQARAAGICAILGMGGAPGITNLMARYLCEGMERVHSIDITLGSIDQTPTASPFAVPYSIRTILDECTMPPVVFEDGQFVSVAPFSGQRVIDMGPDVGLVAAHRSLHSEVASLPLVYASKGVRSCAFRIAFPADFQHKLKFLVDLGLGATEPLLVQGHAVSPREVLIALLDRQPVGSSSEPLDIDTFRVDVAGERQGVSVNEHLVLTFRPIAARGVSAGAFDTAIPPALVALMLARGEIEQRGVLPPEIAVDPAPLLQQLAARGPLEGRPSAWL